MSFFKFFGIKKFRSDYIRRYKRVKIPLLVRYFIENEGEGRLSNLNDLAAGGIRFTVEEPLTQGKRIRLKVKLPWRDNPLDVYGKVKRCVKIKNSSSYRVAAQFVGMRREDMAELESFIDALTNERFRQKQIRKNFVK